MLARTAERVPHARSGSMTSVMRAVALPTGPRALRVGVLRAGRIVDERLVTGRAAVTIGPSEAATFVVDARQLDKQKPHALFERAGDSWRLARVDGMTGRVASGDTIADLAALPHRFDLDDDARGKIVIGDTTLLFQVAPAPPEPARPRLPLSVKNGIASQVDWRLTVLAAFSFLMHFGFIGAMYSDWMDPAVGEDVTAGIVHLIGPDPSPPVVETEQPSASTTAPGPSTSGATPAPSPGPQPHPRPGPAAPDPRNVQALLDELGQTRTDILGAVRPGPATALTLRDGVGAPVDLNQLATRSEGVKNGDNGLGLPQGAGTIQATVDLQQRLGNPTAPPVSTSVGPIEHVKPIPVVTTDGPTTTGAITNLEAVIRRDLHPRARRCYQKDLDQNSTQSGRLVLVIRVAASGEVSGAYVESNSGLSQNVASCIVGAASGLKFDAPAGGSATVRVPFGFYQSGAH